MTGQFWKTGYFDVDTKKGGPSGPPLKYLLDLLLENLPWGSVLDRSFSGASVIRSSMRRPDLELRRTLEERHR